MKIKLFAGGCILVLFMFGSGFNSTSQLQAQDFVYQPTNPAFGGSYLNYSWMLSSANTQNKFKSTRDPFRQQDPLADFEERLQRQILSELTRELVSKRFDDINLKEKSNFQFGEFNIELIPGGDGVTIDIFNNMTGDQTSVSIPTNY